MTAWAGIRKRLPATNVTNLNGSHNWAQWDRNIHITTPAQLPLGKESICDTFCGSDNQTRLKIVARLSQYESKKSKGAKPNEFLKGLELEYALINTEIRMNEWVNECSNESIQSDPRFCSQ